MNVVYSWLSYVRKLKRNLAGISSIDNTLLHGNKPIKLFCQQIDRKHPLVKWTAEYVFS